MHLFLRNSPKDTTAKINQKKLIFSVAFCLLAFLFIFVRCQQNRSGTEGLKPLPQDPFVQVYLNQNPVTIYNESYRQVRRNGDDLEALIIDAILAARSTVDVAVQELRLPKIARSLVKQHQAGVKVRVILENQYSRPLSELSAAEVDKLSEHDRSRYQEFQQLVDANRDGELSQAEINQSDALVILRQAGVPVIDDTADNSKGSGLMHHKFVLIDNQQLIVTSANFTTSDIHGDFGKPASRGNPNNLLRIESAELGKIFAEEFNLMWGDGPGGKPDSLFGLKKPFRPAQKLQLGANSITLQFSPISPTLPWNFSGNGAIAQTLETAKQSVNLALFVFSEQQIVNVLETSHQRGVEVKALIDPSFAYRSYSEALDMMGVALPEKCRYEANNRPWENAIATVGVPLLLPGDRLHHKFGVIDGETVITGSHNWSDAANHNNDETLLIVKNPVVAAHFEREFERLYKGANLGVTTKLQEKIQAQLTSCPSITTATKTSRTIPGVINLNTATQAELESLPGVGKKLAERIIAARQQQPFTSLEDLDRVPGVGPKMIESLRDRVTW